jgi:hypothetical protein
MGSENKNFGENIPTTDQYGVPLVEVNSLSRE